MSTKKSNTSADYVALFKEAKLRTEEKEAATVENFKKFTALNSSNCFYKGIPEEETISMTQALFNKTAMNSDIRLIVERTYKKNGYQKNEAPLKTKSAPAREETEEKPRLSRVEKENYNYKNFPGDLARLIRDTHLQHLAKFNYNDIFMKKIIVFYSRLNESGPQDELFDVGGSLPVPMDETMELAEKLKELGLLRFEEKQYKKRTDRITR